MDSSELDSSELDSSELDSTELEIYTDGSCMGPPTNRKAGCGIYFGPEHRLNCSLKVPEHYNQTNQVAELFAIYVALGNIDNNYTFVPPFGSTIKIYTDSQYAIKCITVWYKTWEKNGWKTASGKPVLNLSLIQDILCMLRIVQKKFSILLLHVRGHSGILGNEEANRLAQVAASA